MKLFSAKVVDAKGKKQIITEEAISQALFEESISKRGFYIIEINEPIYKKKFLFSNKISGRFIFDFSYNIYTLLDFGIDINEVFRILSEIYPAGKENEFIKEVISSLKKGEKLSVSIKKSKYNEIFDDFYITMISSGEQSGKLKEAFKLIYSYIKDKKKITEKLISASVYPIMLVFVSFVILNFLLFMIIPMIEQMYYNMDYKPVLFIQIIFNISKFLNTYVLFYFIFLAFMIASLIIFFRTKVSKIFISLLLRKMPVISKVAILQSKIKTSFSLEILLRGGYSLEEALLRLSEIEIDKNMKKEYLKSISILKDGSGVRNAFRTLKVYDARDLNIIEIADSISKAPEGFEKIHTDANLNLELYLDRVFELLNPVILIFMGMFVFFIMYLVVSPTIGMLKNFQ